MTRDELKAEHERISHDMRDAVGAVKMEMTFAIRLYPDAAFARNAKGAADKLAVLVERGEALLKVYLGTETGPVKAS